MNRDEASKYAVTRARSKMFCQFARSKPGRSATLSNANSEASKDRSVRWAKIKRSIAKASSSSTPKKSSFADSLSLAANAKALFGAIKSGILEEPPIPCNSARNQIVRPDCAGFEDIDQRNEASSPQVVHSDTSEERTDLNRKRGCFTTPKRCPATPMRSPPPSPLLMVKEVLHCFFSRDHAWQNVSLDQFRLIKKLGEGDYGDVWAVEHILSKHNYALKTWKRLSYSVRERHNIIKTMDIVQVVTRRCPYVLRHIVFWQENGRYCLLTDLCPHGNLQDLMQLNAKTATEWSLSTVKRIAWQLAKALHALHSRQFVHMDVKPSNIYLTERGDIRLGDFGLAAELGSDEIQEGDSRYMAPELLLRSATPAADVFSWGITLYELLSGQQLPTHGDRWHLLRQAGGLPRLLPSITSADPPFLDLIAAAMNPDPTKRPSAEMLTNNSTFD